MVQPEGDETPTKRRRSIERTARSPYLDFLRWTNFFYVGAFYLLWIYGVLPRVLPDWNRRLPAALLILALPGYQKLAAMSHPDNLHLLAATLCTRYEATVEALHRHLAPLENLRFSGRSGMFRYSWLHEMLRFGKDIIAETVKGRGERLRGGA